MKCTFISSSMWTFHDRDLWSNALKRIPHNELNEYPTEDEDRAAQRRDGNIMAWHLTDGTVMIAIDTKEHSRGQTYSDAGYFILSDIEKATENSLRETFRVMEEECLNDDGYLYKALRRKYEKAINKELVEAHVRCLARGLEANVKTILKLIKEK